MDVAGNTLVVDSGGQGEAFKITEVRGPVSSSEIVAEGEAM